MEANRIARAFAARTSAACSVRIGDCLGMVAAGLVFVVLSPAQGAEAVFRDVGYVLASAGLLLSSIGIKGRMGR